MKKLFTLMIFILTLCLCLASCGSPDKGNPDDGKDEITEWTVEAVYARAQNLGYEGSLEDFIDLVSGKDGKDGDSAYDIAVKNGFKGTEVEWLATLVPMGGQYTVTFDLGYENKKFAAKSVNYKVEAPVDPEREGFEFLGWYYLDDNNCFPWIFPAYAVTEDMTLVAQWSAISDDGTNQGGITYDYTWSQTDIIVKLTNSSNSNELSSGCKRYYAGADTSAFADIDTAIRARNQFAQKEANVKVKYRYIEESDNKGWGASISDMIKDINSGSHDIPDIYCNFAYDMTCASLRGCFANLLKDADKTGKDRTNFFRFIEDDYTTVITDPEDYFDSSVGEGYFYQYMRSLSLTPDTKLYCLASDYTLDVMRAFLVMPVNVGIINGLTLAGVGENPVIKDYDNSGEHDIDDFYKLVWDGGWNYDALAAYAAAAYEPGSDATKPNTDLSDSVVGLALGKGSGLTSSGLLYTTSVKILQKDGTSYKYPETNSGLNDFATKLFNLVNGGASAGICVVNGEEGKAVVSGVKTELEAIRSRFASGNVLFGGIIAVGSLEDKIYQDMSVDGGQGFGVVPVPMYKAEGEEYKTLVHNIAKIVAISKVSTKFSQCSAFLDYQSRSSENILKGYYDMFLSGTADNAKMLNFIKNHANDCFDKTFEDIVSNYAGETEADAMSTRFHGYIQNQDYKVSSFDSVYKAAASNKAKYLGQVLDAWAKLN